MSFPSSINTNTNQTTTTTQTQTQTQTQTNTTTTTTQTNDHPYSETFSYDQNPPVPLFNYIIDPNTLEIIQDLTGQP